MPNGWTPRDYLLDTAGVSVPINQTDYAVSKIFPVTAGGSQYMTIAIYVSAVTATATAKLQSGVDAGSSTPLWEDARSAALVSGWNVIRLNNAASQAQIPLLAAGRIVVTTNGTGTVTITKIYVMQEL